MNKNNKKVGILDPLGINNNPINDKPYSENYKMAAKKWANFPAYKDAEKTIESIKENNVSLIISGTGSGKTVLIPKFVWHIFDYDKKVAVILPRQIITKASAEYAAETLDVKLGEEVGFKHRGEKKYDSNNTKLLYTTDGTLTQMLLKDPLLSEFNAVVIDEAHERRVQTDFLLYLLKQICIARKEFKLIIMSATVDESVFSKYFSELKYFHINIGGKTNYPITHKFSLEKNSKSKSIENGIQKINELLKETNEGDILFFVPSIQETFSVCKRISKENLCIEFFAGMSREKEELAVSKDMYKIKFKDKKRKIIIATNVAESSITFDGITYVIDSGYENYSYFDPKIESKVLEKQMTSQAQIKQRCGRTGRTGIGICHHLYTKQEYGDLREYPKPGIQTSDITPEALSLLMWPNVQTMEKLRELFANFIEPPTEEYVNYAERIFLKLGIIQNNMITQLGKNIAMLPVAPMQGIAMYAGYKLGCVKEIIAIVVLCELIKNNINELFNFDKSQTDQKILKKYENIKNKLMKKGSDHFSLLKIFMKYRKLKKQKNDELNEWINDHYLKKTILEKANKYYKKMAHDVVNRIKSFDITNVNGDKKPSLKTRVLTALVKGYSLNTAYLSSYGYKTSKIKNAKISKDSWLSGTEKKRVLYSELFTTNNNTYMQIVSHISKKIKTVSENMEL